MTLRGFVKKVMVLLFIGLMIINSSMLLVVSTAIDVVERIIDKSKVEAVVEIGVEKYVNYNMDDEYTKGVMLQTNVKTGIEYQEGQEYQAIKSTDILLNMPKINEEYPEKVEVLRLSTKATNAEETEDYQQQYEKETGELKIVALNNENIENARDEYRVIAYYSSNCYTQVNENRKLNLTGKLKLIIADEASSEITKEIDESYEVIENISGLISTEIITSDIYNGYIESNIKNNTTYKTEYTENMNVQVSYRDIADEVKISTKHFFINSKDVENETQDIVYKSTKLNKNEVMKILGENGKLEILANDGNVLGEINKESVTDENGMIEIFYDNEPTELTIRMSGFDKIGDFNIQNVKQIKETMKDIDNKKIKVRDSISCNNNIKEITKVIDENTKEQKDVETIKQVNVYDFENSSVIDIKDAVSEIEITVDNTNWTNEVQNDVNFSVKLNSNTSKNKLLKNSTVKINFPAEVEKVIISNYQLVYGNGMSTQEPIIQKDENGIISVVYNLNGEQKSYIDEDIGISTELKFFATVILKKDIDSKSEKLYVEFENQDVITDINDIINKDIIVYLRDYEDNDNSVIMKRSVNTELKTNQDTSDYTDSLKLEVIALRGNETLKENDAIYEGEFIKYNIKVTNKTNVKLSNINIKATIPEGVKYGELETDFDHISGIYQYKYDENLKEKIFSIADLDAGETYSTFYEVQAKDLEDNNPKEITTNMNVYVNEQEVNSYTIKNIIKKAKAKVFLSAILDNGPGAWDYVANVETYGDEEVELKIIVPKEYKFRRAWNPPSTAFDNGEVNVSEDNIITMKVKKGIYYFGGIIQNNTIKTEGKDNYVELIANASVTLDGEEYKSNENRIQYKYASISVKMTSENEGEKVKYGEEINYQITIEALGGSNVQFNSFSSIYLNVTDYLPKEVNPLSVTYNYFEEVKQDVQTNENGDIISYTPTGEFNEYTKTRDISGKYEDKNGNALPNIDLYITVPFGKKIVIDVKTTAGFVYKNTEISNKVEVTSTSVNSKDSNIIKHIILPYDYDENNPDNPDNPDDPDDPSNPENPEDPDNPENPDEPNEPNEPNESKYTISGIVWVDENENGKRDIEETRIQDITVMLVDMSDSGSVMNKTKTDSNGKYNFEKLEKGQYIVLFRYDTKEYGLTEYKKIGISNEYNSDVFEQTITLNGEKIVVAATDILQVNSDVDIEMGLVKNKVFDLKLEKTISSIEVKTGKDIKTYTYNNTKLAKVEINRKKLDGAEVAIKYDITVINEGEVEATLGKIVDYLPNGFELSNDSKQVWIINDDGTVTTNSLQSKKIAPNESETITLIATKKLSSSEMGTFINSAEILSATNDKKLNDVDSIYGDKNKEDDDYSTAEVIISVSTGRIILISISSILIILLIIALMIYAKKYKWYKKIGVLFLVGIIGISMININKPIEAWDYVWEYDSTDENPPPEEVKFEYCYYIGSDGKKYCEHGKPNDGVYNNKNGSRHFLEGINNAGGFCIDDGEDPYSGYYKFIEYYKPSFVKIPIAQYASDFSISGNTSENINIKKTGENYIVGPLKINTQDYDGGYSVVIYDKNGNEINDVTKCNENGGSIDNVSGNATFYLKISQDNLDNSISKVQLVAEKTVVDIKEEYYEDKLLYRAYETDKQDVLTDTMWKHDITKYHQNRNVKKELEWTHFALGGIKISKKDKDTSSTLSGAKFKVKGPSYPNGREFTTNGNGEIQVNGLIFGNYTVTETRAPSGYNLSLQNDKTKEINISDVNLKNVSFFNRKYGSIYIIKIDKATGQTLGKGFKFRVYILDSNGNKKYIKNTYMYNEVDQNKYTTDPEEAYVLTTGTDGKTEVLSNLPLQNGTSTKIKYYIEEFEIPSNLAEYYELNTFGPFELKNNFENNNVTTTKIIFENPQEYISISGYVWENKEEKEKDSIKDDLYVSPEPLISGITVRLKDKDGNIIDSKNTDENGQYKFTRVSINNLSDYYIEFEYNGLRYQPVTSKINIDNGSKASEESSDRTNFNNSYASITGGKAKDENSIGCSRDVNGQLTNKLKYQNGTYSSTLVQNTGYTSESTTDKIISLNNSMGAKMCANTKTAQYILTWTAGTREIKNVNLGLYERMQPDLAITTDIDNVELTINGYEDTCHYNERSDYINDLLPDDEDYKEKSAFSVDVKNKNTGKYKETTYVREIYDSYIAFTKSSDSNDSNRLRVYVTYKIIVKNESDLISKVSLKNYVDTRYESASIIASKCYYNGNSIDVNWTNIRQVSGMNVYETEMIDQYIDAGNSMTIYVTYEVNKEGILYLISNDETNPLKHTTEIKSYSTFDSNKNVYAGIDTDSAPDNIEYGNVSTYEEDTDSSPDLKLKRKQSKQIYGLVFEDSTEAGTNLKTGEERIGDGVYTDGENVVENAKVELLNYSDNSIAKLYSIDPNGTDGIKIVDAQTITNGTGQYTLEGLVPGQYYIEYTYGAFEYNGESKTTVIKTTTGDVPVTTQNYKSTILDTKNYIAQPNKTFKDLFESSYDDIKANFDQIKDSNALWYWYQNTNKSSAVDNYEIRKNINTELSEINYGKENDYLSGNSANELYIMKADTAIMDVPIEKYNYQQSQSTDISSLDTYELTFGIVERPRQSLEVTKEVSHIKLMLTNGQSLVEGDPRTDELPYVKYPEGGSLTIEVDNEIIEGATLEINYEISIKNNSELDYNTEEYYKYGIINENVDPVTMTIKSIVDYMDEDLKTAYTYIADAGQWRLEKSTYLREGKLISEDVYNTIKNNNNILVDDCNLELKINDVKKIYVNASKLLSTASEMNYRNFVEILNVSNQVGRFYGQKDDESITKWKLISPGSLVMTNVKTYEADDSKAELNIIPPQGENRNKLIYIIVGISCLSLLVGGIILIKKKLTD